MPGEPLEGGVVLGTGGSVVPVAGPVSGLDGSGWVCEGVVCGVFARGGGGIGSASPAAATSTSPVTQTGVWSLEAE